MRFEVVMNAIRYRKSTNFTDTALDDPICGGQVVEGEPTTDGKWLQVDVSGSGRRLFLPIQHEGKVGLRPLPHWDETFDEEEDEGMLYVRAQANKRRRLHANNPPRLPRTVWSEDNRILSTVRDAYSLLEEDDEYLEYTKQRESMGLHEIAVFLVSVHGL